MSIRYALWLAAMLAATALVPASARTEPVSHPDAIVTLPDQIKWSGTGNKSALLLGDPGKPGRFVSLLDWKSGAISRPHYHLKSRTFIVLKGHWDFGSGAKFDPAAMRALPEGSVVTVPAGGILYDGCKQAPCLVEIVGEGEDPEFMVDENGNTLPGGPR